MAKSDYSRESKRDFSSFKPKRNNGRSFGDSSRSRNRDGPRNRDRSRSDKKEFKLYPVVCSSCGKKTEVPFRPTLNKPVYCSECFEKNNNNTSSNNANVSQDISKRLEAIEQKIDLILEILDME